MSTPTAISATVYAIIIQDISIKTPKMKNAASQILKTIESKSEDKFTMISDVLNIEML